MKNFIKYTLIILISILATFYSKENLNILFVIPLLVFFMFNGIQSFLYSLIGTAIGSLINYLVYNSYIPIIYLLISLTLFFISYHLQLLFNKLLILNYVTSIFFSIVSTYLVYFLTFNNLTTSKLITIIFLSIIISFIFAYLIKGFSFHLLSFNNKESKILLFAVMLLYISCYPEHIINKYIPLTFCLLIICYFSLNESIIYTLSLNALLIILSLLFNSELLLNNFYIYLPISILLNINKTQKKYLNALLVLTCFILIYFIFSLNIDIYYIIMGLIISFSCLFIDYKENKEDENKYYLQYVNYKNKMLYQLDNFKDMFMTLSNNFTLSCKDKILYNLKEDVFDKFCKNCNNYNNCSKKGKHLLLNYLKDSINNKIDDKKIIYIKQNCIKQESYFKLVDNFTNSYLIKKYEDKLEYKTKKIIANDFNSFAHVISKTHDSFLNDRLVIKNNFFKNLKYVLKDYYFDILFINDMSTSNSYYFKIAIKNINQKQIIDVLIPLINQVLQSNMEVLSIDKATLISNYFILTIKEKEKLSINFAIKQSNEDIYANGDSYASLIDDNIFYLAISDGMGHGVIANEESKFATNTLFSMLKAKIEIQESIKLTNNIIQLKNEFDTYSTLDLLAIDLQNNIASFFKLGAINGFIIRNHIVTIIQNYSIPLGIVDNIDLNPSSYNIKSGDIIILCSDGMIDDNISIIIPILENLKDDDVYTMCNTLFSQLINIRKNVDDATLALIKIN